MDVRVVSLIYNNVTKDFNGLFSVRRIFCLGLITGMDTS